jgi:hypothetical protein
MPKVGDIVLYRVQGKEYNALVFHARTGETSHLGAEGEPLLHLYFVAPDRDSTIVQNRLGYMPEIQKAIDVVHASHEFSEQYAKDHGLNSEAKLSQHRGEGEWEELSVVKAADIPYADEPAYELTGGFTENAQGQFKHQLPSVEQQQETALAQDEEATRG